MPIVRQCRFYLDICSSFHATILSTLFSTGYLIWENCSQRDFKRVSNVGIRFFLGEKQGHVSTSYQFCRHSFYRNKFLWSKKKSAFKIGANYLHDLVFSREKTWFRHLTHSGLSDRDHTLMAKETLFADTALLNAVRNYRLTTALSLSCWPSSLLFSSVQWRIILIDG